MKKAMTKTQAIELFGSKTKLIQALQCSRQTVYMWDEELTVAQSDRVIGAAMRVGVERTRSGADMTQTIQALI